MSGYQPLSSHIEELRSLIVKILILVSLGTASAFYFSDRIIQALTLPYTSLSPTAEVHEWTYHNTSEQAQPIPLSDSMHVKRLYKGTLSSGEVILDSGGELELRATTSKRNLFLFSPLEGFRIAFWVSLVAGLLLTFPVWSLFCLGFLLPALTSNEKKSLLPFSLLSTLFIALGLYTAQKVTLPLMNETFFQFNHSLGHNLWSLESYLDYTLGVYFAHAVLFEMAFCLLFLVYLGWINKEHMQRFRKGAWLSAFILGALLTPPDILSQLIIALPLLVIYEAAYCFAALRQK